MDYKVEFRKVIYDYKKQMTKIRQTWNVDTMKETYNEWLKIIEETDGVCDILDSQSNRIKSVKTNNFNEINNFDELLMVGKKTLKRVAQYEKSII